MLIKFYQDDHYNQYFEKKKIFLKTTKKFLGQKRFKLKISKPRSKIIPII